MWDQKKLELICVSDIEQLTKEIFEDESTLAPKISPTSIVLESKSIEQV